MKDFNNNGPTRQRRKDGLIVRRSITDQAVYNLLTKRAKQGRIEICAPHDFRRTIASQLIDRCSDVSVVKELMGHADIQTTARYDRRGESVKRRAAGLLHLPFESRYRQPGGEAEK